MHLPSVIPKKQIATLNELEPGDADLVGGMFLLAGKLMKRLGHTDYRTVFNCGRGAQQHRLSYSSACAGRTSVHLAAGVIGIARPIMRPLNSEDKKEDTAFSKGRCLPEGRKCAVALQFQLSNQIILLHSPQESIFHKLSDFNVLNIHRTSRNGICRGNAHSASETLNHRVSAAHHAQIRTADSI